MRRILLALALANAGTLAACDHTTAVESNGVTAARDALGVKIYNRTSRPLAVIAFDPAILPLIEWIHCDTPDVSCLRVPANGQFLIPASEIAGGMDNSVVVYAWTVVASPGGYITEDVATLTLPR